MVRDVVVAIAMGYQIKTDPFLWTFSIVEA